MAGLDLGRPTNRALIDGNDLVQVLQSLDGVVLAGSFKRPEEVGCQSSIQDVVDQAAFARARNTRDNEKESQWQLDSKVLEVVVAGPLIRSDSVVRLSPLIRHRHLRLTAKILTGQ